MTSGNFDNDSDGESLFSLSSEGKLCLGDLDELYFIGGQSIRLGLSLDDGYGRIKYVSGQLDVDSTLIFESSELGHSWYNSPIFGTFNYEKRDWIYHLNLGWLYLQDDGYGGFWLWDPVLQTWWWTNLEIFPWIYRDDYSNWSYFKILPSSVSLFDSSLLKWSVRK